MLVPIAPEYFFKDDKCCFLVCRDKGLTKFPGGVEAPYYKPLRYPSTLHAAYGSLADLEITPSPEFVECCKRDFEVWRWLRSIDMPNAECVEIYGKKIKFDKDTYAIKNRSHASYFSRLTTVFWHCYLSALRDSECSSIDEIHKMLDELVGMVKKHCEDNGIECPDIQKGNYPKFMTA